MLDGIFGIFRKYSGYFFSFPFSKIIEKCRQCRRRLYLGIFVADADEMPTNAVNNCAGNDGIYGIFSNL